MRFFCSFVLAICMLVPAVAGAHATPVSYAPESSASLAESPRQVEIRFSERLEEGASNIKIEGPKGIVSEKAARISPEDARVLSVALQTLEKGTYKVTWSVVSEDDGHFTRGSYFFAIGEMVASTSIADNFQLVTRTTTSEAVAMTVELVGNGILWATLLLWLFALRGALVRHQNEKRHLERLLFRVLLAGAALIVIGGAAGFAIKTSDLATLHEVNFIQALDVYAHTAAGTATLMRMAAGTVFFVLSVLFWRRIVSSARVTWQEGVLMGVLAIFAYFRAIISHATANHFHPEFSIAVNFLHVIEKDVWAGMAGILFLLAFSERLRSLLKSILGRAFVMMGISAAAVAASATYIVWLHLKSFDNLRSTAWSEAFLPLLVLAGVLVGLRTLQVLARRYRGEWFSRNAGALLVTECAVGILVIYVSSVVILTSPPLPHPPTAHFSAASEGLSIELGSSKTEDGMLLLVAGTQKPMVTLGGAAVELQERFPGGYVFPSGILGAQPQELLVVSPQEGKYDARASFVVRAEDFAAPQGWEYARPFDVFTQVMLLFGIAGVGYALLLVYASSAQQESFSPGLLRLGTPLMGGAMGAALVGALALWGLPASGFNNPYKAQCEADGNMWHLMLPSKAGVPSSRTAQEGCMWGMGAYLYMFADAREYAHYRALGEATVQLASPERIYAGLPVTLTVSLRDAQGAPAELFVDMEKLVHMVVVSQDQTAFAHIHAAETPAERAVSTFTFRHVFPKAGKYLVSIDYAHGVTLGSKQFALEVLGAPVQGERRNYPGAGEFGGYEVSLDYPLLIAGEPQLLRYHISKEGVPVDYLEQYLSAAMHISVVKDDLSAFLHVHGEVHASGTPPLPVRVVNGKIVHNMAAMSALPSRFGPYVETHLIFPTPGFYTVWGEFKAEGKVVPTAFTVKVEE